MIHEYLNPGDCLTVSQMESRGLKALRAASERVRARYGFACTRTDEESARLREWVARYGPEDSVKIISQLA